MKGGQIPFTSGVYKLKRFRDIFCFAFCKSLLTSLHQLLKYYNFIEKWTRKILYSVTQMMIGNRVHVRLDCGSEEENVFPNKL